MYLSTHLILGKGEVGKSLAIVLGENASIIDKNETCTLVPDLLHVCFPYSETFINDVSDYIEFYKPYATIIHSTVPIGTTKKLSGMGYKVYHSPVRGKHPNLEGGLRTFSKDISGEDEDNGKVIELLLQKAGIPARFVSKNTDDTEFAKIMCTTRLGWESIFNKEMKKRCDELGVDFDYAYTRFNQDYNDGYTKLGMPEFHRSLLKFIPGKFGGHCVTNNCHLDDNYITRTVLERNETYDSI